jgi:hypothetical protein
MRKHEPPWQRRLVEHQLQDSLDRVSGPGEVWCYPVPGFLLRFPSIENYRASQLFRRHGPHLFALTTQKTDSCLSDHGLAGIVLASAVELRSRVSGFRRM